MDGFCDLTPPLMACAACGLLYHRLCFAQDIIFHCDNIFLDLIRGMLCYDPHKRLTARQALDHEFFRFSKRYKLRHQSKQSKQTRNDKSARALPPKTPTLKDVPVPREGAAAGVGAGAGACDGVATEKGM